MVLALNVSVYFCKLLPLHMNGNLPVGIGMHVFAMICDLIHIVPVCYIPRVEAKERECWKFLDWRLNSENESRVHGQPSI
eukprot:UN0425